MQSFWCEVGRRWEDEKMRRREERRKRKRKRKRTLYKRWRNKRLCVGLVESLRVESVGGWLFTLFVIDWLSVTGEWVWMTDWRGSQVLGLSGSEWGFEGRRVKGRWSSAVLSVCRCRRYCQCLVGYDADRDANGDVYVVSLLAIRGGQKNLTFR